MVSVRILILISLIPLVVIDAVAATHHVPSEYATIQAGVDACVVGDTVIVAPGIYTGKGNIVINFQGVDIVLVSESGPDQTIIDCENQIEYGILLQSGESSASEVDGFTICNSQISGIRLNTASTTISNVIIRDNVGGTFGGGIALAHSNSQIRYTLIQGNSVTIDGGGVDMYDSIVYLKNVVVQGNHATWGGGIYASQSDVTLENCRVVDNVAIQQGGGFRQTSGVNFHINNCEFIGNSVLVDAGGGLWIHGPGVCENSIFRNNHADANAGGAMRIAGADVNVVMRNLLITENTAYSGGAGALVISWSAATFENCTFADNTTDPTLGHAAGFYFTMWAEPTVSNCLFSGNIGGTGIGSGDGSTGTFACNNVWGNDGGEWSGDQPDQTGINGNISEDPQFCGIPGSGNYYLQSDSPCAPANNECEVQIGAMPVGCGITATEDSSFSEIKSLY